MEWWSWAATTSAAVISLVAMGVATWQAWIARGSAKSSAAQAQDAKRSADAAIEQARSAKRSAEISESAQKFERISELQAAKKILNHIEAGVDMAFSNAVEIGTAKMAKFSSERLVSAAYEFKYLPIATAAVLAARAKTLHEDCARFSHLLESANYEIWSKEEIRPECVALNLRIDEEALALSEIIDAEIKAHWNN